MRHESEETAKYKKNNLNYLFTYHSNQNVLNVRNKIDNQNRA